MAGRFCVEVITLSVSACFENRGIFMNEIEHTFPLPELELHKLDEVKEEIVHPVARRMRRLAGANAWTAIAISVATGLLCGWVWRRRG
jgi:hypothetical protein